MKKRKKAIILLGTSLFILSSCIFSYAAMSFTVYGSLTSGNWNPFKTDVAQTNAFVGWVNQNVKDNEGQVMARIKWKDSNGYTRTTTNTIRFVDIAGKTPTVSAKSGNDNSDASSYHSGWLVDFLSGKSYSAEGYYYE